MVADWPKSRPANVIRSIVFFGLLYLYVWLVVEPCLIYSCGTVTNFPVFYKGWAFFRDAMSYPGGLLRYVSALLPQFFYYSWAGALVITVQAWAISICTGWFLRILAVPGWGVLQFVPALLVLVTYARYSFHFPTIMGSLASLLLACVYMTVASRGTGILPVKAGPMPAPREGGGWPGDTWARCPCHAVAVYFALSVVSYTISAAAYLHFAVLCALYELLWRRRYVVGLFCLLLAAALPYVEGVLLFRVSVIDAYGEMLPLAWHIRGWGTRERTIAAVYALYLFPIAVALLWGLGQVVIPSPSESKIKAKPKPAAKRKTWFRGPALQWVAGSLLLFAIAGAAAFGALDREQKALLEVHYYACHRMWPQVLQAARGSPASYVAIHAVNRALYHTGRLHRDMFRHPQDPGALLLTGEDHLLGYWHKFDTLLDLGLVNLAEKNLAECMETYGAQPMILRRFAVINMVKGKIGAARIYLGALQMTLFHGQWARDYLSRLDADPTLSGDPEIQHLRAQCLRKDDTVQFSAREPMLLALVEQGGHNRMAFEYLMAQYLLTKQLDKLVQNMERLGEFGYAEIPPLWQEALVIYAYGTRKPLALPVRAEVRRRIEHFSSVFNQYGRDKEAAFAELARDYYGSYFFYHIYASGPARK